MNILKIIFFLIYLVYSFFCFLFFVNFAFVSRLYKKYKSHNFFNILITGVETSSNIRQISSLLSNIVDTHVYVIEFLEHSFYNKMEQTEKISVNSFFTANQCDHYLFRELKKFVRSSYLIPALFRYDVIFFNWSNSFLAGNLDYILIRLAGIILVVRHCGDDVRYRPLQHGVHKRFGIQQWERSSRSLIRMLSKLYIQFFAEQFAIVLSSRDFATFQKKALAVRPYIQSALPMSSGISSNRPLLLHAPSDPTIKGTIHVIKAIDILKNKNIEFDFLLLTGKPHTDVLEALGRTTILIDQPGAFPARLATEGFASGCVVIGGNAPEIHGFIDCPALQFPCDAVKLAELLEDLIRNTEKTQEISRASLQFWRDHCSEESFALFFGNLLQGKFDTFLPLPDHTNLLYSEAQFWYEKVAIKLRYGSLF